MARTVTTYDIVLSCPTDVEIEKEIIKEVIEDFNRTIGNKLNTNLNLKHWSTDSYAQAGGAAQELLNKQFIDDSDMIICIFWGRMGTPTDNYESGTAEEMQKAIENGKQVFLYFSNAPIPPRELNTEQLDRVKEFEKKVQDMKMVYYKNYNDIEEFKSIITTDLNLYFLQTQNTEKEKQSYQNKSDLIVSGVENKKLVEDIGSYNINHTIDNIIKNFKTPILTRIERINNLEVVSNSVQRTTNINGLVEMPNANFFNSTPYNFSEEDIELITVFSKSENIDLNTTFFHVGNLETRENLSYMSGLGGSKYILSGSDKEKEKQKEINNLVFEIYCYLDLIDYLQQFKQIKFVRLALSNQGTIFENDITVTLKFPSSDYMKSEKLLPPGPSIIEEILDNNFISSIFGDINSVEINSYNYPVGATLPRYQPLSFPGYDNTPKYKDLKEDYFKEHKKIECYSEYEENGYIVQKYHFEELKQYTSISFPTVLLFNYDNDCVEIEYEIISRNNPHKKQKIFKVN